MIFVIFNFIIPFGISTIVTELIFDTLRVSYRTGQIFIRGSESRIEYWKDAIQAFIDYPFTGLGIGSWKIFSISYGNENMRDYVVPYHAHNDFLQILAELGVLGGILAIIIITVPLYYLIKRAFFVSITDGVWTFIKYIPDGKPVASQFRL